MSTQPVYPDDVQAALDRGRDEGWSLEVYQAALSMALGHLDDAEPEDLEVVVMFAETPLTATMRRWSFDQWVEIEQEIMPGCYLVCPHCMSWTKPVAVERVIEYRDTWWAEADDGVLYPEVGSSRDGDAEAWWYECQNGWCCGRLSLPDWLEDGVTYV